MAAIDQWNASILKLDDPGKVAEHWNPDEPSQFFWLDDPFGVTQYEDFLVHRWNHILPQIRPMLRKGAKIVMTSRDYIYNRARKDLKESAFPLLRESQVVIDVHDLTDDEKRQILYNHLKLGKQPRFFRKEIKPYLEGVADHRRFIPETARRLANPLFTRDSSGESVWHFKHPTIGDAYAEILVQSPEHLGIYIQGSTPERLIDQVTCGDVGIEKAVVIPKSLFPQMLAKIEELLQSKSYKSAWLSTFGAKRDLQGFLARRYSKEFLSLYLHHNPRLLEQVSEPGLFLDTVPEVRLAERLHEYGLLPEQNRKHFVETVSNYALGGQDVLALDDDGIRRLFTDAEIEELGLRARTELLPRLGDVRREWESNHSLGDPPEEYMQHLMELFDSLKGRFGDDETALELIESQIVRTSEWIEENTPAEPERSPRKLDRIESSEKPQSSRSIFDDIDTDA